MIGGIPSIGIFLFLQQCKYIRSRNYFLKKIVAIVREDKWIGYKFLSVSLLGLLSIDLYRNVPDKLEIFSDLQEKTDKTVLNQKLDAQKSDKPKSDLIDELVGNYFYKELSHLENFLKNGENEKEVEFFSENKIKITVAKFLYDKKTRLIINYSDAIAYYSESKERKKYIEDLILFLSSSLKKYNKNLRILVNIYLSDEALKFLSLDRVRKVLKKLDLTEIKEKENEGGMFSGIGAIDLFEQCPKNSFFIVNERKTNKDDDDVLKRIEVVLDNDKSETEEDIFPLRKSNGLIPEQKNLDTISEHKLYEGEEVLIGKDNIFYEKIDWINNFLGSANYDEDNRKISIFFENEKIKIFMEVFSDEVNKVRFINFYVGKVNFISTEEAKKYIADLVVVFKYSLNNYLKGYFLHWGQNFIQIYLVSLFSDFVEVKREICYVEDSSADKQYHEVYETGDLIKPLNLYAFFLEKILNHQEWNLLLNIIKIKKLKMTSYYAQKIVQEIRKIKHMLPNQEYFQESIYDNSVNLNLDEKKANEIIDSVFNLKQLSYLEEILPVCGFKEEKRREISGRGILEDRAVVKLEKNHFYFDKEYQMFYVRVA